MRSSDSAGAKKLVDHDGRAFVGAPLCSQCHKSRAAARSLAEKGVLVVSRSFQIKTHHPPGRRMRANSARRAVKSNQCAAWAAVTKSTEAERSIVFSAVPATDTSRLDPRDFELLNAHFAHWPHWARRQRQNCHFPKGGGEHACAGRDVGDDVTRPQSAFGAKQVENFRWISRAIADVVLHPIRKTGCWRLTHRSLV